MRNIVLYSVYELYKELATYQLYIGLKLVSLPFKLLMLIVYIVFRPWVSTNGRGLTNYATPTILIGNKLIKKNPHKSTYGLQIFY